MATDITKAWEYPRVDPDGVIVGISGLVKAMPVLYGPNFVGTNFSPKCCNIRTGEVMEKNMHHCTHNDSQGHAITKQCFLKGHQSFCLEWIEVDGHTVRCGVRLKVESGGCGQHPSRNMDHSNNLLVKNLISGKLQFISWGQLNGPDKTSNNAAADQDSAANRAKQAILAQYKKDAEEMDTVGNLPEVTHAACNMHVAFNEIKIQRGRSEAEERKLRAAERKAGAAGKSGVSGKFKKMTSVIKKAVSSEQENARLTESERKRLMRSANAKSGGEKKWPTRSCLLLEQAGW